MNHWQQSDILDGMLANSFYSSGMFFAKTDLKWRTSVRNAEDLGQGLRRYASWYYGSPALLSVKEFSTSL